MKFWYDFVFLFILRYAKQGFHKTLLMLQQQDLFNFVNAAAGLIKLR